MEHLRQRFEPLASTLIGSGVFFVLAVLLQPLDSNAFVYFMILMAGTGLLAGSSELTVSGPV